MIIMMMTSMMMPAGERQGDTVSSSTTGIIMMIADMITQSTVGVGIVSPKWSRCWCWYCCGCNSRRVYIYSTKSITASHAYN